MAKPSVTDPRFPQNEGMPSTSAETQRQKNHRHGNMNASELGNHRWILGVSRDSLVRDVAVTTIQMRLDAVCHFLPLAANRSAEDIEYVHQLRVSTRRAVAAVRLYEELLPKRPCKKLCQKLKQIRRAAGTARDCDVMIQRHGKSNDSPRAQEILNDLRQKRSEAQGPLRKIYRSCARQQTLKTLAEKNLQHIQQPANNKNAACFGRWARRQLRACARKFFAAEPDHLDDLESLHEFRIHGKDLRYAMELLAAAFPESLRTELYPLIEQLQDHLGTINDHAVAIERFHQWRKVERKPRRKRQFKKLIQAEERLLSQSLWEFAKWWTPRRSKRVQRRYRALVNDKKENP